LVCSCQALLSSVYILPLYSVQSHTGDRVVWIGIPCSSLPVSWKCSSPSNGTLITVPYRYLVSRGIAAAYVLFSCASRTRTVHFYDYESIVARTALLFCSTTCSATLIPVFILPYTAMYAQAKRGRPACRVVTYRRCGVPGGRFFFLTPPESPPCADDFLSRVCCWSCSITAVGRAGS
jgi:hypothetical protein